MSFDDKEMEIWLNLLRRRSPSSDDHWDGGDAAVFWRGASLIVPPHLTNLSQFPLCLSVRYAPGGLDDGYAPWQREPQYGPWQLLLHLLVATRHGTLGEQNVP